MQHSNLRSAGLLTFVFYPEGEMILAHCLELDMLGQGKTRDEARGDLKDSISTFIEDYFDAPEEWEPHAAPNDVQHLPEREVWDVIVHVAPEHARVRPEPAFVEPSQQPFALNRAFA